MLFRNTFFRLTFFNVVFLLSVFSTFVFANTKTSEAFAQTTDSIQLKLRKCVETEFGSGTFHTVTMQQAWKPGETAIIVCDMWDLHHCYNAVQRVGQLAPRMNAVLDASRNQGITIIHAPSSCMDFYKDHPARTRATQITRAEELPDAIDDWCHQIPAEEKGEYPIDQTDGGEDDDPKQHEAWAKDLKGRGLDPKSPWTRQTSALTIDGDRDFISDNGTEIWSILEDRKIENVILLGVHTNMCVLGRPFGLRQMAKNGKNVVLMRDMTDTMYNPAAKPFVNHFSGTDLIIEHIEKFVCPTITSVQMIGGSEFVFPNDKRPHIAVVIAEDEYETVKTVPAFCEKHLRKDYRLSYIFASKEDKNKLPGVSVIDEADVLLLSVRRRTLPPDQLELFRKFAASKKPMIGIRTSSHAFCLRKGEPAEGYAQWKDFDAEVWGGNYSGHTKNGAIYTVEPNAANYNPDGKGVTPIFSGVDISKIVGHKSLYLTEPLAATAKSFLHGVHPDEELKPSVAWMNTRASGGLSFYTSLGHVDDFAQDDFQKMLVNVVKVVSEQTMQVKAKE